MAAERFDIEVRDLVAKTIRAELKAIGTEARATHSFVQQMNRELATGTRAAAAGAQTASASAAAAASRTASATAKASSAEAQSATARVAASTKVKAALETEGEKAARIAAVVERAEKRKQAAADQTAAHFARVASQPGALVGSKAQNAASNAFMMSMGRGGGGGGGGGMPPLVPPTTVTQLERVAVASTVAAKGIQSVGQTSMNARIAMLDMTHVGINMGQMLATGVNPMRALLMESGRLATAVQYSGGSIRKLLSDTAAWIGLTKKVSDAEKDAAAAVDAAAFMRIAAIDAQSAAAVGAAETEIALASAQQRQATTATEAAAANARMTAANQALVAANAEAAISSNAVAAANERMALTASEAAAAESVAMAPLGMILTAAAMAAGLFTVTLVGLHAEANHGATGLKTYTKEMGYTASEVKKLNAVTVSFGDTAKAVFQVLLRNIASRLGYDTNNIKRLWNDFLSDMWRGTKAALSDIYASFASVGYGVAQIVANLKQGKLGDGINAVAEGYRTARKEANQFFDDVVKQSRVNARAGQDAMAKDMFNAPHQKKPKQGWDRAKELRDANAELDVQIGMLDKYGAALERAQQIEQIGRTFREHNAPLTAAETKVLSDKITKLQEGKLVQEAATAAEEAANGPQRKYAAAQAALNMLYADGAITAEDYTNQLNLATRAYDDAIDPLSALNRELQHNGELMGLYGRSRDVANYIAQLREAAEAKGGSIYKRAVGPQGDYTVTGNKRQLNDDAQSMVDQFRKQQRSEELTSKFEDIDPREKRRQESTTNFILDNYKEMYAAIDEFRKQDVANEEEAAERKKNLDTALGQARLETAANIFGMLAGLQSSHNRTVAAIGKAAAITQATIDGITAVQAALKGPPGPPWSYAIAAATAVMTAANVAKIAGIGFQQGGYTGDGSPNDVAGPAHRQEFIFDAAATRRIGVPALEAMRSGARLNGTAPSNDNRSRGVTVHQYPGVAIEVRERTDGEIEVLAERAARRVAPGAVAADMGNPNSRTSKAMTTHFGARRNRG